MARAGAGLPVSVPGKGSTFSVWLPLERVVQPAAAAALTASRAPKERGEIATGPGLAEIPVVIISLASGLDHGIAPGAMRVLQKPFSRAELTAALAGTTFATTRPRLVMTVERPDSARKRCPRPMGLRGAGFVVTARPLHLSSKGAGDAAARSRSKANSGKTTPSRCGFQ